MPAEAQCAMCRAVLENEEGQGTAKGINNGIIYLMAIPYLLIAGIGIVIYKKFFQEKKHQNVVFPVTVLFLNNLTN